MFRSFILRGCRWLIRHLDPSYDRTDASKAEKSRSVWDHESQFLRYLDDVPELKSAAPASDPVKIIWQFWWQGEEAAPLIVRRCMESARRMCAGYQVILVDKDNIREYLDIPDFLVERFNGREGTGAFSDYVRFALLARHGGIWLDASEYMTGTIPDDIANATFYLASSCYWMCQGNRIPEEGVIRALDGKVYPNNDYLVGNSGIVVAKKGSRIALALKHIQECYWREVEHYDTYLFVQYFQTLVIWYNAFCREEYEAMPKHDYCTPNILRTQIGAAFDPAFMESVKTRTFMHKLSYKNLGGFVTVLPDGRETFLGRILKGDQL